MRWASAISQAEEIEAAVADCADRIRWDLAGTSPDLAVVFVSPHHAGAYEEIPERIADALDPHVLIGASAGGVIGDGREVEDAPAVSITAALLPNVETVPFHLVSEDLPAPNDAEKAFPAHLELAPRETPQFLLLPDPFSLDAALLLDGLDAAYPGAPKVGGLASGGRAGEPNALFLNEQVFRKGGVGLAFTGDVVIDVIVAQGCRPIGEPMFVTKAEENLVFELDDRPPVTVLRTLYESLDEGDRELFNTALFLGIAMEEKHEYRQGDFLIRNLIGLERSSGALVVGERMREQMVVQFHLRDAETSAADLNALLTRHALETDRNRPRGALLFSCLGRGKHLYGRADHDTGLFRDLFGEVPLGGFFANGEIGPVGGRTYLHGYTSSFGLFRPKFDAR